MHLDQCIDLDQKSLKGLWTKHLWKRELSDPQRICLGLIDIDKKNNLLGFCTSWLVLDEFQITSIAVDPLYQRKGLGKLILSDLIKRSKFHRVNQINLEVKDTNQPAIAFYKSMGFKIEGQRSNFYRDGSNALVYVKKLSRKS